VRILALSDLFPPLGLGGYEVAAREVAQALRQRGHEVHVLTTDWGTSETTPREPAVSRTLHSRLALAGPLWRLRLAAWESDDDRVTRDVLARTRPDVILLWNVGGVAHRVLAHLLNGGVPAVVYVFGDWPLRKHLAPHDLDPWAGLFAPRDEPAAMQLLRRGAATVVGLAGVTPRAAPLRFDHFEFGSRYMQDLFHRRGLVAARTERLIYYGVSGAFARLADVARPARRDGPPRLLFVGRLWEAKGVHTLVEAFAQLGGEPAATLTVAGPEEDRPYTERLRKRAADLGVADRIVWRGPVPRDVLPEAYGSHDIVVFPSTYDEPFGIVQLEAMAAGCAVVGTGTGGSAEILEPDTNALLFAAGDAASLAAQLRRLRDDPALGARLGAAGKETVRRRFAGERMVDEIEAHLADVVAGAAR